jgi:hypothetical protein
VIGIDALGEGSDSAFSLGLEATARRIVAREAEGSQDDYARETVGEQVAALLDRIVDMRREHQRTRSQLISLECEVGTDLLDTEAQRWWYSDRRMEVWRDRQRLVARRASLELERMRDQSAYHERLRQLHERLLMLIQRHRALRE